MGCFGGILLNVFKIRYDISTSFTLVMYVVCPEMLTFIEGWILGSNHQPNLPTNIFLLFLALRTPGLYFTQIVLQIFPGEIFQAESIIIIIIIPYWFWLKD